MKKIIATILLGLAVMSCSSLSSEEYYKRGNYINALAVIPNEIKKGKEDVALIKNRVQNIVSIFENNYRNAESNYVKAEASYKLFQVVNLVQANVELQNFTNVQNKYNAYDLLSSAIKYTKLEAKYSNTLEPLRALLERMNNDNLVSTKYQELHREYSRYVADSFYDVAKNADVNFNYEKARDYYKLAYEAYSTYDKNYRNSYTRYNQLNKKIELAMAVEYVNKANRYNVLENYNEAINEYIKAINIYEKYGMYSEARPYKDAIEQIQIKKDLIDANDYYNKAFNYYNNNNYSLARDYFVRAHRIYSKYNKVEKVNQIKVYLENIEFKKNKQSGEEYYNDAVYYFQRKEYIKAKEYFIKAREIYSTFNNTSKVNDINAYIELINTKIGGRTELDEDKTFFYYYNKAVELKKQAESVYSEEKRTQLYNEAIKYFEKSLKYVINIDYKNKINRIINELKSYDEKNSYDFYYKKGLEHYNKYYRYFEYKDKEKAIYFLKKAYEIAVKNNLYSKYEIKTYIDTISY